jgi:pantetheine-phosphate adenylyltransferase
MRKLYEIVGLGGTFDHLHVGHEHFIKFAYQFGQHLHIGITHPKLTQGKLHPELIENYETRKRAVAHFCKINQISAAISQLNDIYGPTISEDSKIRALVVTQDTLQGADKINQTRQAMDMYQLPVQVCTMLKDKTGQNISADRIRSGQINRQGEIYQQIFDQSLTLNDEQRQLFSQPHGEIVDQPNFENSPLVCVVGDESLEKFITNEWNYDLGVYDLKMQRQAVDSVIINSLKPNLTTTNPAGGITSALVSNLAQAQKEKLKHVFVEGEEDLAAAALVLLTPLGTQIYYGQPHQGLIKMIVTEEKKDQLYQILNN